MSNHLSESFDYVFNDGIIIHTKKIQLAPFKSKILMNTSTLISFTKAQQQDYNLVFF